MKIEDVSYISITQDSRKGGKGVLFFALEGVSADGHRFVEQALEAGSPAAVIRKDHPLTGALLKTGKCITVADTRVAFAETAAKLYGDPSKKLLVCGVTGTNGKTTTTYLLESILRAEGKQPAVIGTVENRFMDARMESALTTPGAAGLQSMFADFRAMGAGSAAIEVSSHALDQQRVHSIQFAAAIFTNLTQDHLDYHKTMENYFEAKKRLFLEYAPRIRVIHTDDAWGKKLFDLCKKQKLPALSFGRKDCDLSTGDAKLSAAGIEATFIFLGRKIGIHSPLLGAYNVQNIAGAVCTAIALGIDDETITRGIERASAVPGRLERVPSKNGATILVDYAHSPDALENVLRTLRPLAKGKLVCVFGCGGDRDAGKRPLMGAIAEKLADVAYVTSDNPRTEDPQKIVDDILKGISKAHVILDRAKAIKTAVASLSPDDILVIAGKGHENYQIIGTTKHPFDDRIHAAS